MQIKTYLNYVLVQINLRKNVIQIRLTIFRKSFASPRFGEKTWNFRNPINLTFQVWLNSRKLICAKPNLDIFDHFSKKFRIATIWRQNLEFLKSDKPNFLGLAKFAQIIILDTFQCKLICAKPNVDIFDHFLKKFCIATIWRQNLEFSKSEKPNFLGLAKFAQIIILVTFQCKLICAKT